MKKISNLLWLIALLVIASCNDTMQFDLPEGKQGEKGDKGDAGEIGIVSITQSDDGECLTILSIDGKFYTVCNGTQGVQGLQGIQGLKGDDGVSIIHEVVSEDLSDGSGVIVKFLDINNDVVYSFIIKHGKSAYELWLIENNHTKETHTITDYLESLIGETGVDGKSVEVRITEIGKCSLIEFLQDGAVIDKFTVCDGESGASIEVVGYTFDNNGNTLLELTNGTNSWVITINKGTDGKEVTFITTEFETYTFVEIFLDGEKVNEFKIYNGQNGNDGGQGSDGSLVEVIDNADGSYSIYIDKILVATVKNGEAGQAGIDALFTADVLAKAYLKWAQKGSGAAKTGWNGTAWTLEVSSLWSGNPDFDKFMAFCKWCTDNGKTNFYIEWASKSGSFIDDDGNLLDSKYNSF